MILAVTVAAWFIAAGVVKLLPTPTAGRRAVAPDPTWLRVARQVRGVLEILGGLAAVTAGAVSFLGLRIAFPGLAVGSALCLLAGWTVVESARTPIRAVRLILAVLGFALAVFFTGFRD